ncbi:amino acid adenylation domain-containing protein [Streptomyces sp. T12]|uniref:non-ribosomal peptide synthetase n=3 Tax=unclassified Streptomyces TaxID=2593676 RepID=UPI0023672259|nr:amino acid adenylation domain-containing protein [Streptomyces sp. T12]WDF41242.1 amino acid adenylation domain-containing protein [Streptomyces sp. T12]
MDADGIGTVGEYGEKAGAYEETPGAPGAPGAGEEYEFPTSDAQARLLVLDHMDPGSATYHVPAAFAVRGPFDPAAFGRALDSLVARHESLRTVFRTGPDGVPLQIVAAAGKVEPCVERDVPVAEVDARMRAEAARPFDVASGPLLRCTLYAVGDGSHRILLVAHHLVCDGWSLGVLLRELSAGYENEAKGLRHALPELPLQFPDFASWQRERQAAGEYADSVAHWAERLRGAPETVALPLDRPRGAVRSAAGGTERFTLSARVRERIAETARTRGGTPFMAVFAAYAAFVSRLSGSEDLVIGFPVSGRDRPELQDMVGMLTNTLALRVDLSGDPTYHDLIGRLRTALLASQPYQDAPFEAVVNAVAPAREMSHDPVVQVVFGYDDDTELTLSLAGAEVERVPVVLDTAKFDFHLQVERWGEDLAAYLIHRSALFEAATVRRWVRCFETLLDGLLAQPDAPLSTVEMVSADERERLLALGDRTQRVVESTRLVPDLVADRAAARPEATALVCGALRLTYRELLERADGLAARLRARGVRRGDRVGLLLPRGADMGIAALAVLRAGGAYVPLDPAHPSARLAFMVANSGTSLLLTAAGTTGLTGTDVPQLRVDADTDEATDEAMDEATDAMAPGVPVECSPDDLAYVLYTSGSTGVPKGVAVEHRALLNLAVNVRPVFPVTAQDRVLQFVSFGFDVAVSDLFFPWVAGAELHIAQEDERLGEALQARLRDSRITYVFLPPSAAMTLPRAPGALPELRTVAVGGEACPAELVERLGEEGRRIVNAYGPSEATVYSTTADLHPGEPVVIGHAVPGTRAHVLDRRLRPVPVGVTGELYVAGASLARGYFGRPGMTAERFVADPYGPPGSRMYRTGDLCRIDAHGVLHYLGRGDSQVKLRGYRIELGEIEALLAGHADVTVAAAAVRGEGAEQRLVAYVVGKDTGTDTATGPSDEALRALLAVRLPGYMVPEIFVRLPELPLNRSGKIDRARLPEPAARRPRSEESYAAPRTAGERRVAEVWQRVLTLDRVGVHDNFFDLGGNSVRLLAVLSALREHPECRELTLIDLFRHPTVAAIAAHLDSDARPTSRHEEAARRGSDRRAALHKLRSRKGTTR